jgi:phosphate acyltransferase
MRIVVDAMGSDHYPVPDVAGSVLAAREWGDLIILVGSAPQINVELAKHDTTALKIEVVHADDMIEMTDKPSEVAKRKTGSSMHIGMGLVKEGKADAFVTAGNTDTVSQAHSGSIARYSDGSLPQSGGLHHYVRFWSELG